MAARDAARMSRPCPEARPPEPPAGAGDGVPDGPAGAYWREMRLDWLARALGGPCSSN